MYLKDSIDTSVLESLSKPVRETQVGDFVLSAIVAIFLFAGIWIAMLAAVKFCRYFEIKDKSIMAMFFLLGIMIIALSYGFGVRPSPSEAKYDDEMNAYNAKVEARDKETKNAKNLISKAAMEQYEIKEAKAQNWNYKHVRNVVSEASTDAPILHVLTSDNKLQKVHVEYDNSSGEVTFISSEKSDAPLPQRKK